jgi:formiminotetrahydrofolate cyclodeaminase
MYFEGKFKEYLDDLAAKKPAPGGGSAAAVVGAIGVGLLSMVANFTIAKERYKDVEPEIQQLLARAEDLRANLQKLIDEDITAYQTVSAAYKMPRESQQEKAARSEAIQAALKNAMAVPLAICRNLFDAAQLCEPLLQKGNVNLLSDVGVAAEFIASGFTSALLNVEINLSSIKDEDLVAKIRAELSPKEKQIETIKKRVLTQTKERI